MSVNIRPGFYDEIAGYLRTLCELCSVGNVLAVFFADATTSPVSYEERWNEVNRKRYQVSAYGVCVECLKSEECVESVMCQNARQYSEYHSLDFNEF